MSTRSTNRLGDKSFDRSFNRSSSRSGSRNSSYNSRSNFRGSNNSFSSNNGSNQSRQSFRQKPNTPSTFPNKNNGYQNNSMTTLRQTGSTTTRETDSQQRCPTKFNHSWSTPKAQVIFKYTDQNPWDIIHMVRNFITYMKGNTMQRQFFKKNKLTPCRFNTEVNESEIQSSSFEQIQHAMNEDPDLVFNALVAADYIDEINTSNKDENQTA